MYNGVLNSGVLEKHIETFTDLSQLLDLLKIKGEQVKQLKLYLGESAYICRLEVQGWIKPVSRTLQHLTLHIQPLEKSLLTEDLACCTKLVSLQLSCSKLPLPILENIVASCSRLQILRVRGFECGQTSPELKLVSGSLRELQLYLAPKLMLLTLETPELRDLSLNSNIRTLKLGEQSLKRMRLVYTEEVIISTSSPLVEVELLEFGGELDGVRAWADNGALEKVAELLREVSVGKLHLGYQVSSKAQISLASFLQHLAGLKSFVIGETALEAFAAAPSSDDSSRLELLGVEELVVEVDGYRSTRPEDYLSGSRRPREMLEENCKALLRGLVSGSRLQKVVFDYTAIDDGRGRLSRVEIPEVFQALKSEFPGIVCEAS